MKVYFSCSARGTKQFKEMYDKIALEIETLGHRHVSNYFEDSNPDEIYSSSHEQRVKFYKQTMRHIKSADVVILEVSTHSLSMGFIMQAALAMNKPVIALYIEDRAPAFATGIENEKLQVLDYSSENISRVLVEGLDYALETSDVRFNFFISPSIGVYFDWISKNKKIPRSVYLRTLIERDMAENEEYNDA